MLESIDFTEFFESVVAKMCYQNDLNMYNANAAEDSAAFVC